MVSVLTKEKPAKFTISRVAGKGYDGLVNIMLVTDIKEEANGFYRVSYYQYQKISNMTDDELTHDIKYGFDRYLAEAKGYCEPEILKLNEEIALLKAEIQKLKK